PRHRAVRRRGHRLRGGGQARAVPLRVVGQPRRGVRAPGPRRRRRALPAARPRVSAGLRAGAAQPVRAPRIVADHPGATPTVPASVAVASVCTSAHVTCTGTLPANVIAKLVPAWPQNPANVTVPDGGVSPMSNVHPPAIPETFSRWMRLVSARLTGVLPMTSGRGRHMPMPNVVVPT